MTQNIICLQKWNWISTRQDVHTGWSRGWRHRRNVGFVYFHCKKFGKSVNFFLQATSSNISNKSGHPEEYFEQVFTFLKKKISVQNHSKHFWIFQWCWAVSTRHYFDAATSWQGYDAPPSTMTVPVKKRGYHAVKTPEAMEELSKRHFAMNSECKMKWVLKA